VYVCVCVFVLIKIRLVSCYRAQVCVGQLWLEVPKISHTSGRGCMCVLLKSTSVSCYRTQGVCVCVCVCLCVRVFVRACVC